MLDHGALERIEMAIKSPACVGLHTKNAECVEESACVWIPRAKLFVLFINYRRLLITVPLNLNLAGGSSCLIGKNASIIENSNNRRFSLLTMTVSRFSLSEDVRVTATVTTDRETYTMRKVMVTKVTGGLP